MNYLTFEALDRIHSIQTMLSSLLSHGDDFHIGLSEEAKIHVDNAMNCLCRAYQAQGEHLDKDDCPSPDGPTCARLAPGGSLVRIDSGTSFKDRHYRA